MSNRIFLTFACPLKWDDLADINGEVSRRQCEKCQCSVQKVEENATAQMQAMQAAEPGKRHCVAIEKAPPCESLTQVVKNFLLDKFTFQRNIGKKSVAIAFSAFLLSGTFLNPLMANAGNLSKNRSCYFPDSSKLGGLGQTSPDARIDFLAYRLVNDLLRSRMFSKDSDISHSRQITVFLSDFEKGIISKGTVFSVATFLKDNGDFTRASEFFAIYKTFDANTEPVEVEILPETNKFVSTKLVANGISPSPEDIFQSAKEIEDALNTSSLSKLQQNVQGLYNGNNSMPKMKPLADRLHTFLLKETEAAIRQNDQDKLYLAAQLYDLIEVRYPHLDLNIEETSYSEAKQKLDELALNLDASEVITHAYPIGKYSVGRNDRRTALAAKYTTMLTNSSTCRKNKNWDDSLYWLHAAGALRLSKYGDRNSVYPREDLLSEISALQKEEVTENQKEVLEYWKTRFCSD